MTGTLPPLAPASLLKPAIWTILRCSCVGVTAFGFACIGTLLAQDVSPSPEASSDPQKKIEPGVIVVVKVQGHVQMTDEKNPEGTPLNAGAVLVHGSTIITEKNSSADLLFSNGAGFHVGADTKFAVEQFEQEHWTWVKNKPEWDKLKTEPTASDTRMKLEYGSIVGNVKPLAAKSKMTISTPLGVAGIRGTTWSLSVTRNASGQIQVMLSVPEGTVTFAGKNGATSTRTVAGTTTVITANLNPDGSLAVTAQSETKMTPEQAAIINGIIQQVEAQTGIFAQIADNPSVVQNTALSGDTGAINGPAGQGSGQTAGGFSTSTTFPGSSSGGGGGGGAISTPTPRPRPTATPTPVPTPTPSPTPTPTPAPTPTPIISP